MATVTVNTTLNSQFAATAKPEEESGVLQGLCQELRREMEHSIHSLQVECEKSKQKQQQAHARHMMKLAKSIKHMTVDDFNLLYKCDLLALIQGGGGIIDDGLSIPPAMKTPSNTRKLKMETPSRSVKKGEGIFSCNGSPLETEEDILLTVTKKKRPVTGEDDTSSEADLNLVVGGVSTCITTDTIGDMPQAVQSEAYVKLKKMHENMAKLLEQFEEKQQS